MSKLKKIVLSVSVAFSMMIALVVGFICVNNKDNAVPVSNSTVVNNAQKTGVKVYQAQDVRLQRGGDNINYSYVPSVGAKESAKTVAYEYVFRGVMDQTAINIKSLDSTDVTLTYAYLDEKWDEVTAIESYDDYKLQKIAKGFKKYIYILVTPTNETIPTTFSQNVIWWLGKPQTITIANNIDNTTTTQTIVAGQQIDQKSISKPASFTKTETRMEYEDSVGGVIEIEYEVTYYFDAWFLDKDYTQMLETEEVKPGQKIYVRYHNIQFGRTDIMIYGENGYTLGMCYTDCWNKDTYKLQSFNPVIPTMYDDGVNGRANVVAIGDYAFGSYVDGGMGIITVQLPSTITSIGTSAFGACSNLRSINLPEGITSISDYTFTGCASLNNILIPLHVTKIGQHAFNGVEGFTFKASGTWYYTENSDYTGGTAFEIVAGTDCSEEFDHYCYWYKAN